MASISEAFALAVQQHQAGQLEAAAQMYGQVLAADPNHAVANNNLGAALQCLGKLDEAVAAFRRALELKWDFAEAYSNLGNVFQDQGRLDEAIACYRWAVQLKPDEAVAYNNLGNALKAQGKLDEAVASYGRALALKPDLPEVHNNLGTVRQAQGKLVEAIRCYWHALQLKPDDAEAYNHLGTAVNAYGNVYVAIAAYQRALELRADFVEAWSNLGNALQQCRRFDEASSCYVKALELSADCAYAHYGQATINLLRGDFASGWPEYEWRWKLDYLVPREFREPRWDGSPLEGRTILLHGEQGLGDVMQFVRYAELVKKQHTGATIVVECPEPLMELLARCRGIDRLVAEGDELPPFDVHVPLLSLPGVLGTSLDTIPAEIPYLNADAALVDEWKVKLGAVRGLRIGINWRGRATTRQRDLPLEGLLSLAELPGVSLISLQKGEARNELLAADRDGSRVVDLGEDFDTAHGAFVDTAAVMMNLDLVITSDTAIPHLAGALGVPVWLGVPFVPEWRWMLDRNDCPWYPTMRLFRQRVVGDWQSVFEDMRAAIRELRSKSIE